MNFDASSKPKNIVFLLTDTFNKHHIGAYGCDFARTPVLDQLAAEGVRFDRAYPGSPLCTPARGCIWTGLHAAGNGCTFNDATPYRQVPILGEVLNANGVDAALTGKWHIEGSGEYFGDGEADGGFPQEYWYDGRNYLDDIGPEREPDYRQASRGTWEEIKERAFAEADCWGTRLADRAIDFLEKKKAGDQPFFLCVSFDEPHSPFMTPRKYLEEAEQNDFEMRPNVNAPLEGKPEHHKLLAEGHVNSEEDLRWFWRHYSACCTFTDAQMGRVIDAVKKWHGDDTLIVFTSDHGEQMGSHGMWGKGRMMYEESAAVPLIMAGPGIARGQTHSHPTTHLDLFPTFLDALHLPPDPRLHGVSLLPAAAEPGSHRLHDHVMLGYERFGNSGRPGVDRRPNEPVERGKQDFFPMRVLVDDRYKLVINLFDQDEFYDHQTDPYEMTNRIDDPAYHPIRDEMHRALLTEMWRTRDPLRCEQWIRREWRGA